MNETAILLSQTESLPFLAAIYAWGIEVIKSIQSIQSPGLTAFMNIITSLGTEYVYIVIVLLIFWCLNEKKGFSLGLLILVSAWINAVLKVLFNQPRPYSDEMIGFGLEPVLALAFEPTRAFPSGHSQMSMTFWIAIASWLSFQFAEGKKKLRPLIWSVAILIILLIGFSRLYLGVHFPTDVLGGWIMALIVLCLFSILEKRLVPLLSKAGIRVQLVIAAAAALIMNVIHPEDTSLSAMVLGFSAGYSLMIKKYPFTAQGSSDKSYGLPILGLRFLLGIVGAAIIYFGLRFIIPGKDSLFNITALEPFYELGRFIRYGLLGFWASYGAPRIFLKFGLASSPKSE
ncbi:MAG: phosphatase PAP2 family protein [Treponema sp.]|jgi:membrane-associated phospholipid phosphatase|nr:phosphatase PAP2 family protein [Treponema sp.]